MPIRSRESTCFGTGPVPSCADAPHRAVDYDQAMRGLAATYWPNTALSERPVPHATGVGEASGALSADWGPAVPGPGLSAGTWSARFSGEVSAPVAGAYTFRLDRAGWARLWVDDVLVVDAGSDGSGLTAPSAAKTLSAGPHRVMVEFRPGASGARLGLHWTPPGGVSALVPGPAWPARGWAWWTTRAAPTPGAGRARVGPRRRARTVC